MCRGRDPGILGLYQSYNSASELCYRLNLTPQIPLSYRSCFPETTEVTSTVQPNQNRFDFFIVSSGNSRFPYSLVQTKIFNQLISSMRMIPYSRPKLSDLYTLSQSKLLENHTLHSSTYLYIPFMAVPPPPRSIVEHLEKSWSARAFHIFIDAFLIPFSSSTSAYFVENVSSQY